MTHFPPRVLTLVVPPAYEPHTLAEAKLFLRVDGNEEDSLIVDIIAAAREKIEAWLQKSLLTQTWELKQRIAENVLVKLPMAPIQAVTQVQVERLGVATTLTTNQYEYLPESQEIRLIVLFDADRIVVQYRCGYADASVIPASIRQGIFHALAHHYHHRELAGELPAEVKRMLSDHREMRI